MNIGIVTTWFERGAAYVSKQYMDVLKETDSVFIYARGGESYAKGDPKWDLPNVYWAKHSFGKSLVLGNTYIVIDDFAKWINKNDIELVLFNEQRFFDPLVWCKQHKIKTVAYIDYYTDETLPLFDIYDAVICNTKRHAFALKDHPNIIYIKWGTDINLYKPSTKQNDKVVFFHSAGMAAFRKGTDLLIEAFSQIKDRSNAKLLIHTQQSLPTVFPSLTKTISDLENDGSLEIVEKTISAPGLYSQGDVYVYPSRLDGIGLTLMEAAASGLICVTTDNPPMNEFVSNEFSLLCDVDYYYSRHYGYYWPLSIVKIESLKDNMEKILSYSKEEISKMKNDAREYAINNLDFKQNSKLLSDYLSNIQLTPMRSGLSDEIRHFDYDGFKKYYRIIIPCIYIDHFIAKMKKIFLHK